MFITSLRETCILMFIYSKLLLTVITGGKIFYTEIEFYIDFNLQECLVITTGKDVLVSYIFQLLRQ